MKSIDTIDPAYYAVADGDRQTTATPETDLDVGGDSGPAAQAHPFYKGLNHILDQHDFDRSTIGNEIARDALASTEFIPSAVKRCAQLRGGDGSWAPIFSSARVSVASFRDRMRSTLRSPVARRVPHGWSPRESPVADPQKD